MMKRNSLGWVCLASVWFSVHLAHGQGGLSLQRLSNGVARLSYSRPPGSRYVLQSSEDLRQWVTISTDATGTSDGSGNNRLFQDDSNASQFPARYYRGCDLSGVWTTTSTASGDRNTVLTFSLD